MPPVAKCVGPNSRLDVGYLADNYAYRRLIVDIVGSVHYRNVRAFGPYGYLAAGGAAMRLGHSSSVGRWLSDLRYRHLDLGFGRVQLIHSLNAVVSGASPWIASFETVLPRFRRVLLKHYGESPSFAGLDSDRAVRHSVELMLNPRCQRLLALSRCAMAMQSAMLAEAFSGAALEIEAKTQVLLPPQAPLVGIEEVMEKKSTGEVIQFMFVGRDLVHKGGDAVVECLGRARKRDRRVKLILVGRVRSGVDDLPESRRLGQDRSRPSIQYIEQLIQGIRNGADWIEYHESLPNAEVLRRMRTCHVGLLPSISETFGYSVLEFQASGCPVITTDSRALNEINSESIGWMINVRKNRFGEAIFETRDDLLNLKDQIRVGLSRAIDLILEDPSRVAQKGQAALKQIEAKHSPVRYAQTMREIYEQALDTL